MTAALILLVILLGSSALLYTHDRLTRPKTGTHEEEPAEPVESQVCCGMHITCAKDSLSTAVGTDIEYYDDDELDIYAGRTPESYTDRETEQFRDILLTLLPDDIAGWGRSLQLRGIDMPESVRQELLLIVSEARQNKSEINQANT